MDIFIQGMLDGINFPVINRPTIDSDIVIEKVCEKLAEKIFKWCNYDKIKDIKELNNIKEDLKSCVDYYKDGYEIARCLEVTYCYESDSELVNILDDVAFIFHDILNELTFEWVIKYQVKNKHQLNDQVNITHKNKQYDGTIIKIDKKRAQYVVKIPELHHVEKGQIGTHGIYFNFEEIDI